MYDASYQILCFLSSILSPVPVSFYYSVLRRLLFTTESPGSSFPYSSYILFLPDRHNMTARSCLHHTEPLITDHFPSSPTAEPALFCDDLISLSGSALFPLSRIRYLSIFLLQSRHLPVHAALLSCTVSIFRYHEAVLPHRSLPFPTDILSPWKIHMQVLPHP